MPEETYPFCYLKDKFLSRIYQEGTGNEGVGFEVEHLDEHSRPGLAHNPSSGSTTRSPQFYFGSRLLMPPFTLSSPPSDSESPHKLFPAKLTLSALINQSEFPQPVIPLFFYPIPQANTKPSESLLNLENRHEINSGNIGGPLFKDDVTIMLELLYAYTHLPICNSPLSHILMFLLRRWSVLRKAQGMKQLTAKLLEGWIVISFSHHLKSSYAQHDFNLFVLFFFFLCWNFQFLWLFKTLFICRL